MTIGESITMEDDIVLLIADETESLFGIEVHIAVTQKKD